MHCWFVVHFLEPFLAGFFAAFEALLAFGFGPGFGGTKSTNALSGTTQKDPNSVSFK
jgi:hypothetical protein